MECNQDFSTLSSLSPANLGALSASKASYFDATLNGSVLNTGGEYPMLKSSGEMKMPAPLQMSIRLTIPSGTM